MRNRLGPILLSGPSDAAVDKFADQVEWLAAKITDKLNSGGSDDDRRYRRLRHLVLRGNDISQEVDAFLHLLQYPGDTAGPTRDWGITPAWRLQNSLAGWVLVCLGS